MAETQRTRLFGRQARQVGSFAMIQPNRVKVSSSALKKVGERDWHKQELWAAAAYDFADQIGEVGFVLNMQANAGARSDLIVQKYDSANKKWMDSDDARTARVMNAFVGPTGGQTELKRRALLHLAIAGESILLGTPTVERNVDTGIFWEFVSSEELILGRGQKPRRRRDGGAGEELGDDVYMARVWKSHPRFTDLADSALRRVLAICAEIVTLTQMVDAAAKSRLAAGLLYVPEEITFADEGLEPDQDDGIDKFTKELMEHLSAPVRDRSSAASLVPLVIRGPATLVDKIRMIDMSRDIDQWAQSLRQEALGRLSSGLDIDPSLLDGKASLNHWTSYNVDVEFLLKHVKPLVDLLADFLTYAYLRPMLEEFEGMTPDESAEYRLIGDLAPLLARADEGASARVLHELGTISDETFVRANGFDVSDMPDATEKRRRIAQRLMYSQPALAPALADIVGLTNVDWSVLEPAAPAGMGPMPGQPSVSPSAPAPADRQVIPQPVDLDGKDMNPKDVTSAQREPLRPGFSLLSERLATGADAAIERAIERAASKAVTRFGKKMNLDKSSVLSTLSPQQLAESGLTDDLLLEGAWDGIRRKAESWIRQSLIETGKSAVSAEVIASEQAAVLVDLLDSYTREVLHEQPVIWENGLRIPDRLINVVLEKC